MTSDEELEDGAEKYVEQFMAENRVPLKKEDYYPENVSENETMHVLGCFGENVLVLKLRTVGKK